MASTVAGAVTAVLAGLRLLVGVFTLVQPLPMVALPAVTMLLGVVLQVAITVPVVPVVQLQPTLLVLVAAALPQELAGLSVQVAARGVPQAVVATLVSLLLVALPVLLMVVVGEVVVEVPASGDNLSPPAAPVDPLRGLPQQQ